MFMQMKLTVIVVAILSFKTIGLLFLHRKYISIKLVSHRERYK